MASRGEELNTRLTATDDASKVIDKVADKVEDLEDRPHEVDLTSDTDQVERELSALDKRLDGLTNEEKRVVLELSAKNAQREIDRINRDLANAQKYDDDEIAIRVTAKGDAERKLAGIQSDIRDLDGATPDIRPEVDSSSLDSFIDKLEDLTGFGGLGGLRGRAGVGLGAGIAAGLVLAGEAAADAAVEVDNIAKLTGASTEQASRLAGVMGTVAVESKDLQDILLQMGGVLRDDAELAESLGININDGRDLTERFIQVVEALGEQYDDTAERSLVASKLFGEEGVRQVNAVTAAYGDLDEAVDSFAGKIWTDEDIERAREYKRRLADIKVELQQIAVESGEGALPAIGGLVKAAGLALEGFEALSGFDPGTAGGLERHLERVAERASGLPPILDTGQSRLARLGDTGRRAAEDIAEGFDEAGDAIVEAAETATERATAEFEQFVSDVNALWAEAITEANAPLDELRQRLENEKIFERLGEQLEKVKAAPGDREETRRLLDLVLDLGEAYDDIPRQKIVDIFTQIDRGQVEAAFNEIQQLANQREIQLRVTTGGTSFRIDPNGGAPTQITTPTQISAVPTGNTYISYQIAPTQGQVVGATNSNQFANGTRSRFQ